MFDIKVNITTANEAQIAARVFAAISDAMAGHVTGTGTGVTVPVAAAPAEAAAADTAPPRRGRPPKLDPVAAYAAAGGKLPADPATPATEPQNRAPDVSPEVTTAAAPEPAAEIPAAEPTPEPTPTTAPASAADADTRTDEEVLMAFRDFGLNKGAEWVRDQIAATGAPKYSAIPRAVQLAIMAAG